MGYELDASAWSIIVLLFAWGASLGSFFNVVIYRLPHNKSLISPRSSCPHCHVPIGFLAIIPIIGYLLIRGKCQHCKAPISFRYPFIEMLTGLGTVLIVCQYYSPVEVFSLLSALIARTNTLFYGKLQSLYLIPMSTSLLLFYSGIVLSFIDMDHRILPNIITIPGIVVGLIFASLNPYIGFTNSFIGMLSGSLGVLGISTLYSFLRKKEAMGLGDVKYLAMIGAFLGWQGVLGVILLACLFGSIIGILVILCKKESFSYALPFGPFLAASSLIMSIWGDVLLSAFYL